MNVTNKIEREIKSFWVTHGLMPSRCFAGKVVAIQLRSESCNMKPIKVCGVKVIESEKIKDNEFILIRINDEFEL